MTIVNVIDRDGGEHQLNAPKGLTLMELLRDNDMGVVALCGGMLSCATCHVYVDEAWVGKLPGIQSDEGDLLSDIPSRKPNSRLSCQIALKPEHDGLKVTVAPED